MGTLGLRVFVFELLLRVKVSLRTAFSLRASEYRARNLPSLAGVLYRSNARLHHTGDLVLGTSGRRLSLRCARRPLFCLRRNSGLHDSPISCGGNWRPGPYPTLCPLSYNDLRRWRDSNPQPCGYWFVEVSRACTTPQTFQIFARSSLLAYRLPSFREHP
jgi:hypothetical protein